MVKSAHRAGPILGVLLFAAGILGAGAWLRGAEYDEQYTLFLTAGTPRPAWPDGVFPAGLARKVQADRTDLRTIARHLRATDVHPPLYFWMATMWRGAVGNDLFALRLFSVACGLGALAAVGAIARLASVPPVLAMLLTLGCYGFAYTSVIARGFALAQCLTLCGIALLLRPDRPACRFAAGAAFGAAAMANYLAAFVPLAALALSATQAIRHRVAHLPGGAGRRSRAMPRPDGALPGSGMHPATSRTCGPDPPRIVPIALGMLPFLAVDLWFFVAQHASRPGQFPPFTWIDSIARLARYSAATLFGGLPLYVNGRWQHAISAALAGLLGLCLLLVSRQWRRIGRPDNRRLFLAAALAPPVGLLALGLVFNTTPIELRYLAFATPFAALLLAGAIGSLPTPMAGIVAAVVLATQALSLACMMTRPETMQPARAAARSVAEIGPAVLVLLPRGNDGVGIVGAFGIEAPPATPLTLIGGDDTPTQLRERLAGHARVGLAILPQDDASRRSLDMARAVLSDECWRPSAATPWIELFTWTCDPD